MNTTHEHTTAMTTTTTTTTAPRPRKAATTSTRSKSAPQVVSDDSRATYITKNLRPDALAGMNSRGAKTERDWLRIECDRYRAGGADVVVAEDPNGYQALTYAVNVLECDRVVYPVGRASK